MIRLALVALLTGCATPYWYVDSSRVGFTPLPTQVATESELMKMCGSDRGCTKWIKDAHTVQSFVFDLSDACTAQHEARHRAGWRHDMRPLTRPDCGEVSR